MPLGNVNDLPAQIKDADPADGGVYRAILESTDQGYCTIEVAFDENEKPVDYRFLEVSSSFERQTGIENGAGRWMREIAPDQDQHWFDIYGRVARTGQPESFENFSTPLNRWFSVYAFKIDGPSRVAVLFDDITERKRTEAALRTSEEQFQALFDQAPLGIYLVDSDLVIRQVNPVALPVFGDIPGGPVGRDFDEIIHILWDKAYADEVVAIFRHTLETGEPFFTPERAEYRADRDIIEYYEWRLDRILFSDGRYGVVAYFRDISDQVNARKEIEKQRESARENEERYRMLFEAIDSGFCILEMIFDENGRATDYRFVEANPAFERQSGLAGAVGHRIREFAPDLEEHWFEGYGRVALTGEPLRFEGEAAPLGRWFDISAFRVGDPEQRRVAVLFTDITARRNTQKDLRQSEARFRGFVTASADVVYRVSPDWSQIWELDGQGFISDIREPDDNWMDRYILPEDHAAVLKAIDHAIRTKSQMELEHRVIRADGTPGWIRSRAVPMLGEQGEIIEWLGTASDITQAKLKQDALRQSEERFTRLFEASPAPLLVLAPDAARFTIAEVNDSYLAATMRTREDIVGRPLFEAFPGHPDEPTSVRRLRASLEKVLLSRQPDAVPDLKYDIARPDGTFEERWWKPINSPILNENGEVEAIIHNANDVTEARRAEAELRESERRQRLLLAELQHRVRNILAMIQAVVRRSLDTGVSAEDYAHHLGGRIAAMARTQAVLTRAADGKVDLEDAIRDELLSIIVPEEQFWCEGPDVALPPKAAEILTLAVHELATNSVKYGAFSGSDGQVEIRWTLQKRDARQWLAFEWEESRVAHDGFRREGFGTELITRRIPYELGGKGSLTAVDGGMLATIEFPLENISSILETGMPEDNR